MTHSVDYILYSMSKLTCSRNTVSREST